MATGVAGTDGVNVAQAQGLADTAEATADMFATNAVNTASAATIATAEAYTDTHIGSSLGTGRTSSGANALAIGNNSTANGAGAIATGHGATANGSNAYAAGTDANANNDYTVAVGFGASSTFNGSVAVGAGAVAAADPATAVGNNAQALANDSVALGANATAAASATNSVALGQGSLATRANTISVGNASTGQTRQITGVAAGVLPNDAVNVQQLNDVSHQAKTYAAKGVAAALAASAAPLPGEGKHYMGLEGGAYGGESALGLTFAYQPDKDYSVNFGVSGNPSGGPVAIRGGVGMVW